MVEQPDDNKCNSQHSSDFSELTTEHDWANQTAFDGNSPQQSSSISHHPPKDIVSTSNHPLSASKPVPSSPPGNLTTGASSREMNSKYSKNMDLHVHENSFHGSHLQQTSCKSTNPHTDNGCDRKEIRKSQRLERILTGQIELEKKSGA